MKINVEFGLNKYQTLMGKPAGKFCTIYSMKTWAEVGQPLDGSFSQIVANDAPIRGSGGVNQRMKIGVAEINFIKSLNGVGSGSAKTWDWAASWGDTTWGGYFGRLEDGTSTDVAVWWNWVGAPSGHTNDRNIMCISTIVGNMAQVVAAPKSADYEQFRDVDWLVQRIWGNYGSMPQLYKTLLFDPAWGFETTKSNRGFWIDVKWLFQEIGQVEVPWVA